MIRTAPVAFGLLGLAALSVSWGMLSPADAAVKAPPASISVPASGPSETAIFAGGCFWGVQGVFAHVKGVKATTAGYAGGDRATAKYELVSLGTTGHAEAVKVTFDPRQVTYADLLRVYFSVVADPTELNRQGPDEGTQYRSALFPQTPAQQRIARAYITQLSAAHLYPRAIVTMLEPARGFFPAEEHHQNFMARNPDYPYIVINDRPKVAALKTLFPQYWRA